MMLQAAESNMSKTLKDVKLDVNFKDRVVAGLQAPDKRGRRGRRMAKRNQDFMTLHLFQERKVR